MNFFDKAVEAVAPIYAAKRMRARMQMEGVRKVLNTGYSEGGAS